VAVRPIQLFVTAIRRDARRRVAETRLRSPHKRARLPVTAGQAGAATASASEGRAGRSTPGPRPSVLGSQQRTQAA
jgi:hypothetical protein